MTLRTSPPRHPRGETEPPGWATALSVFDALSRQGRLAVFRCIVRAGEDGVETAALLRELRTTGSALTLHLRSLADAGLIHARGGRSGRFVADLQALDSAVQIIGSESPRAGDS